MAEEFARRVTRSAVARLIRGIKTPGSASSHYHTADGMALDIITELAQSYMETVGEGARLRAENAGRAEVSMVDVLEALKEMPLYNPSTADMIVEAQRRPHTDAALDDGFAIPAFPVEHKRELYGATIASAANEETGRPPHVPMHLPPFPDKHTYRSTKRPAVHRVTDPRVNRRKQLSQGRHIQDSLATIHKKRDASQITGSGGGGQASGGAGAGAGAGAQSRGAGGARASATHTSDITNPFLAAQQARGPVDTRQRVAINDAAGRVLTQLGTLGGTVAGSGVQAVGAFGADDGLLDVNPAPAPALAPPRKKSRHGKHRSSRHHKSKSTKEKKNGKTAKTPRPSSKSKAAKGGASSGGGAASSSAAASASTTTGTIAAVKPVV